MPRARPISSSLWQRLADLDHRCDAVLRRRGTQNTGPLLGGARSYARMWRVEIFERSLGECSAVTCEAPDLSRALEGAVGLAEGKWGGAPAVAPTARTEASVL